MNTSTVYWIDVMHKMNANDLGSTIRSTVADSEEEANQIVDKAVSSGLEKFRGGNITYTIKRVEKTLLVEKTLEVTQ